jgi:hypothetical protein
VNGWGLDRRVGSFISLVTVPFSQRSLESSCLYRRVILLCQGKVAGRNPYLCPILLLPLSGRAMIAPGFQGSVIRLTFH